MSIGGTGIWVMHFMAMIGFGVVGSEIRYDLAITALSVVVAVAVVGAGLFIVGLGRPSLLKIVGGGLLTGLGVNAMHYIGMAAMRLDGEISYDPVRVIASIVIAVVAATVALWLSVTVRSGALIFGSAMVMGVAVTGMHYTGMSAMSVRLSEQGAVNGASSTTLIGPIALAVVLVVMGLVYSVLAAPTDEDRAGAAFIESRMGGGGQPGPVGIWASTPSAAPMGPTAQESAPADATAGGAGGGGSVASRFARRGGSAAAGSAGRGGSAPAGSGGRGGSASAGPGRGSASPGSGGRGSRPSGSGGFGAGFAPSGGGVPAAGPMPGDPAPAGLGASLRETEPFSHTEPPASGGRWAGLTAEPVHPVPRPITEAQYDGRPAGAYPPPPATMPELPGQLPRREPDAADQGQLPHRNAREPWTPSPAPTRND
ncbi:MHYT domain-containing protein [Virgisporangium ochraceum]|uniref:MHYT domain-containing protein n=1 Tax=Virgisporangium ochraceum TaxID=65505 RepID=UPI001EF31BE8|nr:MHYT domain-containing protein [Virgisporangium ochraceum]